MDLKERFMKYEAAEGLYFVVSGLLTCYVSLFYQQYVIQVLGVTFGWYIFSRGLRKILVNRVKQTIVHETLVEKRKEVNAVAAQ